MPDQKFVNKFVKNQSVLTNKTTTLAHKFRF